MSAENIISTAIISKFSEKLINGLKLDVALVGGGPSALVAARYLADAGLKAAVFERKLAPGGGTWGGGMLFNEVVVQDAALDILDDFNITHTPLAGADGYHTLDSVEMASGLIFGAVKAGATIFNSVSVEDLVFKNGKVNGLVINWTPVERLGMHVDPLTVIADNVIDGTGHPSEILNLAVKKAKIQLDTPPAISSAKNPCGSKTAKLQPSKTPVNISPVFTLAVCLQIMSWAATAWGRFSAVCSCPAAKPQNS